MLARMISDQDNPAGRKKEARSWLWMDGDRLEVLTMPSTWLLNKLTDEGVQNVLTD
jgi:hypothetical protein